jgi:hypothetical protein
VNAAVDAKAETQTQTQDELSMITESVTPDRVKNIVRRYPSLKPRDANGKIVRAGRNLSGNQPFAYKYYYLNPSLKDETQWTDGYREAFAAAPNQVKLILKAMARFYTSDRTPALGAQIVNKAKESGMLVSTIDSDRLFAYYRRALETLGVIHAVGWGSEDETETETQDAEEIAA